MELKSLLGFSLLRFRQRKKDKLLKYGFYKTEQLALLGPTFFVYNGKCSIIVDLSNSRLLVYFRLKLKTKIIDCQQVMKTEDIVNRNPFCGRIFSFPFRIFSFTSDFEVE